MRAEQGIMLAVGGLGVLAAIALFAGGGKKEPRITPQVPPQDPPRAPGKFPELLGTTNQRSIKKDVRYWGRLDYATPPSRADIVAALDRMGLANAVVYESLAEAAEVIPAIPFVLENASVYTRWFQATATRTESPLSAMTKPAALTYLWVKGA